MGFAVGFRPLAGCNKDELFFVASESPIRRGFSEENSPQINSFVAALLVSRGFVCKPLERTRRAVALCLCLEDEWRLRVLVSRVFGLWGLGVYGV